ncbi:hypothetical protein HMI55_002161 [Coelomomyces lativittatus]|nr:hypothetical protein HMI55_002161 [Coelomomyces lativittatus]
MLLQKREAYRHVLYNLPSTTPKTFVPKLGVCLFLFEVYLRLLRMSKTVEPFFSLATSWSTVKLETSSNYNPDVVLFFSVEWLPLPIRTMSLVVCQYLIALYTTLLGISLY